MVTLLRLACDRSPVRKATYGGAKVRLSVKIPAEDNLGRSPNSRRWRRGCHAGRVCEKAADASRCVDGEPPKVICTTHEVLTDGKIPVRKTVRLLRTFDSAEPKGFALRILHPGPTWQGEVR